MIYGVDYGSRRIAIAGPDDCYAVLLLSDPRRGQAAAVLHREVQMLGGFVASVVPEGATIWLEQPFTHRNTQTAVRLGVSAGAILARHAGSGYLVSPTAWKASLLGNGHASKDEIAAWLAGEDPAASEACAGDQDLIDACCIRRYGELVAEGRLAPAG